jgi:hypothetical protein
MSRSQLRANEQAQREHARRQRFLRERRRANLLAWADHFEHREKLHADLSQENRRKKEACLKEGSE